MPPSSLQFRRKIHRMAPCVGLLREPRWMGKGSAARALSDGYGAAGDAKRQAE
jgi:hypothetical protein